MQPVESGLAEVRAGMVRLEKAVQVIGEKLDRVILDTAEFKGRVSQLPSTVALIGFVLAVMAGAGVLKYFVR